MILRKLAYHGYRMVRQTARWTGLDGLLRRFAGPAVGKLLFNYSSGATEPAHVRGHLMYLAAPGGFPPVDMVRDRYEPGTTQYFEDLLQPGMVLLDVGAHVGYYTMLAARHVGASGKIYAFEPAPANYDLLLKNIALNGYENVMAIRSAVSDQAGSSTLYLTALDNGRHSIYRHDLPQRGTQKVDTTTIDTFIETQGWPKVDIIKVDVEGAEMNVLAGMARLLENQTKLRLIIELNPPLLSGAGVDPLELIQRTVDLGFSVGYIDDKTGVVPLELKDVPGLVKRLSRAKSSVNLVCTR